MSERCPKCGSEKVFSLAGLIVPDAWQCPLDPKDCRIAALEKELEEAKANYQFMVDRAADEKLDGYREFGNRAAQAENALDAHKAFHFAIGKALGMMYEADGHADEPAPMSELVDAIKRQVSERDEARSKLKEALAEIERLKNASA